MEMRREGVVLGRTWWEEEGDLVSRGERGGKRRATW